MHRLLIPIAALSLLAATSTAQCFEQNLGVLCPIAGGPAGLGDDVLFDLQPMNFAFPMGGLAASYTHAHICSNGVVYLTNGAGTTGSSYAYQATAYFTGAAGSDPRIAPFWIDLESSTQFGGGTYFNNTIPGKFVVTWLNSVEWAVQGPAFTIQAQIFANGDVTFYYSPSVYGISSGFAPQFVSRCGVSEGNGVVVPGPVDLSAGNTNLTNFAMFEEFPLNVFDLQSTTVTFLYAGTGYVQIASSCVPAFHESYGAGCYDISNSFYEFHADAAGMPAFNGQSMTMTPTGTDYLVTWGGGTYVPPTGAVVLALGDDGQTSYPPSIPFPTAAGPVTPLWIGANGIVSLASNPDAGGYVPDADTFLNCSVTAFWSWHDFNPAESGSGPVTFHEGVVGGDTIAYITWDNVENYPTAVLNPSRMQFQFNLTTGAVTFVWVTMDGSTASPFGSGHLVGWSPAGSSTNGGSLTLAAALPFLTSPANVVAMALGASPAPVSSPSIGTTVTYTTTNMTEFAPGAGVYIGMNILSLGQVPGGLDLTFLGAPGCSAYVASLDYTQAMVGASPTNSVSIALPTGLPVGTQIFSQSVGLITPNSLPNGQNAFGLVVSNGVRSFISSF